jgi:hypothetical protein
MGHQPATDPGLPQFRPQNRIAIMDITVQCPPEHFGILMRDICWEFVTEEFRGDNFSDIGRFNPLSSL